MTSSRTYPALLIASIGLLFAFSAWGSLALTAGFDRVALIWFSNGIVVAAMLVHDRLRGVWFGLIGSAFTANLILNFLHGDPPAVALGIATANLIEICIAAYALRGVLTGAADLLQFGNVVRFLAVAMIIAPGAAAVVAATTLSQANGASLTEVMRLWIAADGLGMGVVVPLALALRPGELLGAVRNETFSRLPLPLLLLLVVTVAVFSQGRYPLLFLLLPPLLFVVFKSGFNGAAIALAMVATIAIAATLRGTGPFMLVPDASMAERVFPMQLLLASLIITIYPICAMLATQRRLIFEAGEQASRMLASQSTISDLNERMRLAASAANIGFYTWQPDGNVISWDEQMFKLLHIDPESGPPSYEAWRARIHPHDLARVEETLNQVILSNSDLEMNFRIVHPDGSEREIRSRAVMQRAMDGRPRQLAGLNIDITELRHLDRMKSEFVSIVSHELRTPLTSIRGALGLLASGRITAEKTPELVQLAQRNAERLAILIDDILDTERIESGKMRFDMKLQGLKRLVEEAIAANTPYATRYQVRLNMHYDAPESGSVRIDYNRMLQVMANLLSNAAKFSPTGGAVDVTVVEQQRHLRITVRDYGRGIAPEFRDKIFGKFSQSDASDTREKGGSGLGLAISKALVEGMGGAISFVSSASEGTSFFVDLPTSEAADK